MAVAQQSLFYPLGPRQYQRRCQFLQHFKVAAGQGGGPQWSSQRGAGCFPPGDSGCPSPSPPDQVRVGRRSLAEGLAVVFHLHFDQREGVQRGSPPKADAEGLGVETGL